MKAKDATFGMRLPEGLRDRFKVLAEKNHHTPAQLVRKFMEQYIEEQEAQSRRSSPAQKT
jgi:predicted DNA-binding protein